MQTAKQKYQRKFLHIFLFYFLVLWPVSGQAQDIRHYTQSELTADIGDLHELIFHPGVNNVNFAGIGLEGQITVAYWPADSTGAHCLYLVTIMDQTATTSPSWQIVTIGNGGEETIDDAPNDGEMIGKTVRFFNAKLSGRTVTLLLTSQIDGDPMESPASATISVQELRSMADNPPYIFEPILEFETKQKYVNADAALSAELGIGARHQ